MAIAFDAVSSGGNGGTSQTFSHTCTGTNRLLFVGGYNQESSSTITGITYDGVALTEIDNTSQTNNSVSLWYLIAPATGANDVVVTRSSSSNALLGVAVSYTGCLQSGVPDSYNTGGAAAGSTLTISTTTVEDNCWITGIFRNESGVNIAGDNTTMRNASSIAMGDTNGYQSPAGAHSLATSWSGSVRNLGVVASFAPARIPLTAKALVIAGGGGGGAGQALQNWSGGGGAGGFLYEYSHAITAQAYSITVGDGGTAGGNNVNGGKGGDSVFSDMTAEGGGGSNGSNGGSGLDGGSGGGGSGSPAATGGAGTAGQGNDGGVGGGTYGGGGGGAGGTGGAGTSGVGASGAGSSSSIDGDATTYSTGATGGLGGGGGGANTGNGGMGGIAGGSGIVIVAYITTEFTHTGGDDTGIDGDDTWVKFTSDGTLTLSSAVTAVVRNLMTLGVGK
jgi:hypothetical protein